MCRQIPIVGVFLAVTLAVAVGCRPQQPFYFFEDGDLSHYLGMATDIEYPDVETAALEEVEGTLPPLTLDNSEPTDIWDLTLEEAVHNALVNSKVMRTLGAQVGFSSGAASFASSSASLGTAPDSLTRLPESVSTIYDPALVESNPRYGTEAALAAFDTQFSTSMFWEKTMTPQNVTPAVSFYRPDPFEQELGTFQARLAKTAATGGTWSLTHNVAYELNNLPTTGVRPSRLFPSDWNVNLEAEFRQPLLQGAGVQFNRIAGPGAIPGYNNGVIIARINTDIALAEFEANVRNLVSDVERAYWALYLAYRELDAVIAGRDSALQTWRKIHALYEVSARGGEAEKEAQAREQYFLFRSQVQQRLSNLYSVEANLRYIMGLASADGRLIRPADEPTTAKVSFDWHESHSEALVRNVDLRRQKWKVKQREMELIAAKNYLLPRLDAVGKYSWLGLGDHMIRANPGDDPRENAYQSLTMGDYQGWQFGLEMNLPIGFRKELAGVRHAQLYLARERAILQEEELELSHQLAHAIRDLDGGYIVTRTNFNRRVAAQKQVDAVEAAYETETVTLDLLLDAQRRLAEAEIEYYRSLVGYNQSIVGVHFRKGSLLEYNGVYLAEGPWPGKAYFDARRRARARDASLYLDYGFTRPKVISRGAYEQHAGQMPTSMFEMDEMQPMEVPDEIEQIPTPAPEIIDDSAIPPEAPPPEPDDARRDGQHPDGPRLTIDQPDKSKRPRRISLGETSQILRAMDLDPLAGNTEQEESEPAAGRSEVKQVSYQQVRSKSSHSKPQVSGTDWKDAGKTSPQHEPSTDSPTAEVDRSSPGWKGVQR